MSGSFSVEITGIPKEVFDAVDPEIVARNLSYAVNDTARHARTITARQMNKEVKFPSDYLAPKSERLKIVKYASKEDLEGIVRARQRATSLSRFVTSGMQGSKAGVHVTVKPGRSTEFKTAFPIKLRSGTASIDTAFNMGLAIRLRPGETIHGKRTFKAFRSGKSGLYLLYGPSVDQVFRGVRDNLVPEIERYFEGRVTSLIGLK